MKLGLNWEDVGEWQLNNMGLLEPKIFGSSPMTNVGVNLN